MEERLRRRFSPEHYVFAEIASERSRIALARGNLRSAGGYAQQAVDLDEASIRRIGQCIAYLPALLIRKSQVELRARQLAMAALDADRAVELLKGEAGAGIPSSNLGRAYLASAQALRASDEQDQAQIAARNAYANLQTTLGSDHPDTRIARDLADSRPPGH